MGRNRKEPLADIPLQEQASREKVLKTAVRMLQEIGYQRTTLRRISAESGVGEGELRRWYKTKDELLAAISEMLLVRASLGGYIMAHDFKYLFPREQLKRLILAQALEVFQVPADRIEMLLVELETQKKKLLEVCCQIFRPEGRKSEKC